MISSGRPTLRDVAREAGVSHMTVSRVVRGERRVSEATRQLVENAIRRLRYRPDPALSALAAYRTREGGGRGSVLAFLECDIDDYSRLVFQGARTEAERLGYTIESHRLSRSASSQRQLGRILFNRGIHGLLFGPSQTPWTFAGWNWPHFAPVSLGALSHHPPLSSVSMDYFDGVMKAGAYLRALGAKRVGLAISPSLEFRTGHRWLGGYAALEQSPSPPPYSGAPEDRASLRRWSRKNQLDAVLTIHKCVWHSLQPTGIRIVFLNSFECPPEAPRVAFDATKIGQEGVRLVHHQILNREFGLPTEIRTVSLQGSLL
ncbi:MAG: LacI family DNA-binding transcriptional regulator [Terrimicrobiaceae bacterium]